MIRLLIVCGALMGLAACAQSTAIYGPDGQPAHAINCDGAANSMQSCYQEAARICPAGYYMLGQDGQQMGSSIYADANSGYLYGSSYVQRQLIVRCK